MTQRQSQGPKVNFVVAGGALGARVSVADVVWREHRTHGDRSTAPPSQVTVAVQLSRSPKPLLVAGPAGTLAVSHSVKRIRDYGTGRSILVVSELKTARPRRVMCLTPELLDVLYHHRTRQAKERLAAAEASQDHGLIFPIIIPISLATSVTSASRFPPAPMRTSSPQPAVLKGDSPGPNHPWTKPARATRPLGLLGNVACALVP
ncbi:hypothetical protein [Krasilnikovia cinnamomea]|uniref:hypothetical protein n=1 Tax=Krasilnikovia cinnamomea TaxID=349313 RepID=UPI00102B5A57|nr:hypothetical protein [Krasilnikovia cinnamomea]